MVRVLALKDANGQPQFFQIPDGNPNDANSNSVWTMDASNPRAVVLAPAIQGQQAAPQSIMAPQMQNSTMMWDGNPLTATMDLPGSSYYNAPCNQISQGNVCIAPNNNQVQVIRPAKTEREAIDYLNTKFDDIDTNKDAVLSEAEMKLAKSGFGNGDEIAMQTVMAKNKQLMFVRSEDSDKAWLGYSKEDLSAIGQALQSDSNQNLSKIAEELRPKIAEKFGVDNTDLAVNEFVDKQRAALSGNTASKGESVTASERQKASMGTVEAENAGIKWEQDPQNPNIQVGKVNMKDQGIGKTIKVYENGNIVEITTNRNNESLIAGDGGGFWNGVVGGTEMLAGGAVVALATGTTILGFGLPAFATIPAAVFGGAMATDGARRLYNANEQSATYTAKVRKYGGDSKVIEYNNTKDLYGAINAELNGANDFSV